MLFDIEGGEENNALSYFLKTLLNVGKSQKGSMGELGSPINFIHSY